MLIQNTQCTKENIIKSNLQISPNHFLNYQTKNNSITQVFARTMLKNQKKISKIFFA